MRRMFSEFGSTRYITGTSGIWCRGELMLLRVRYQISDYPLNKRGGGALVKLSIGFRSRH